MGNENNEELGFEQTVTLTLDNDLVVECAVLYTFDVEDKSYMALLPIEQVGDIEEDEVLIYRYTPSDDGELHLDNIESDEEYEAVADAFDELLDAEEFEDLDMEDFEGDEE